MKAEEFWNGVDRADAEIRYVLKNEDGLYLTGKTSNPFTYGDLQDAVVFDKETALELLHDEAGNFNNLSYAPVVVLTKMVMKRMLVEIGGES